jgi:hypothetical protein
MNATHEISPIRQRPFLAGFWLFAAIPITLLIVIPLNKFLSFDFDTTDSVSHVLLFLTHFGTGYLWARSLGKRSGFPDHKWMYLSGALGFSLSFIGMFGFLALFDPIFQKYIDQFNGVGNLEFGALFAPWFASITGISGLALGLGLRKWKLGLKMFGLGFATGFLIYLAIMYAMQLFGFTVGSGRPVMLPTTFLSMWVTALVGSGLFGKIMTKSRVTKN